MFVPFSCNEPVTTTIIWRTTDRIPHSLIFKRMQIKRIVDNNRAFFFLLTNWKKEPDEEKIYRWTDFFFTSWTIASEKNTGARAKKQKYIYLSVGKPFWKRVYICCIKKKTILVKKRHFYVKKKLFYKLNGCKKTAFLQKIYFCKKAAFLCKKSCFFTS